ncbi:MAG TPA: hypothetical protein VK184_12150 [Nostocaceae cyanobacterium]|nr:hypothetical protein [Nostocaceae cyanobacterium]
MSTEILPNLSNLEGTIDITAETIVTEETTTEETTSKVDIANLEATIKDLHSSLEQAQIQEVNLQQQIKGLQTILSEQKALTEKFTQELETVKQTALLEQKALTEKFTQELEEAKQTILQLAAANSQLIEEKKSVKQPQPSSQPKINSQLTYRKSHLAPNLPVRKAETPEDFSKNTWLYD